MKNIDKILLRNQLYADIRDFMRKRNVIEVEVPFVHKYSVPNPHIKSMQLTNGFYLQTSPELFLKQLITDGTTNIFSICKAYRDGEISKFHNPEFTMLEYYQRDFNDNMLSKEVIALLQLVLADSPVIYKSYRQLFLEEFDICIFEQSQQQLNKLVADKLKYQGDLLTIDTCLQWLLTAITDNFAEENYVVIYDFPATQAEMAKVTTDKYGNAIAKRFEIYKGSVELANGYHELDSSSEQLARFNDDNNYRLQNNLPEIAIDKKFITKVSNLGNCAGVAIGIDRILMLKAGTSNIADVLLFNHNDL